MKHPVYLLDDEALALRRLTRMLEATGRVDIVGQSTDPEAALAAIAELPALALVFLDISMPGLDGFAVCERLPPHLMVAFTTAHDDHALRAFTTSAIDYLMKPIRDVDLSRALDKLDRLRELPAAVAHEQLVATMRSVRAAIPERIASRLGDRIQLVELERITHCYAEAKLTYVATAERSFIVDPSITELEERYAHLGFFRIHRATLVRLSAIVELVATAEGTKVRLASGADLLVARERVRALKDRLGLG